MLISVVVPIRSSVVVSAVIVWISSSAPSSAAPSSVAPALEWWLLPVLLHLMVSWRWRKWKIVGRYSVESSRLLLRMVRVHRLMQYFVALLHVVDVFVPLCKVLMLSVILRMAPWWQLYRIRLCCCSCYYCCCCCVWVGGSSLFF